MGKRVRLKFAQHGKLLQNFLNSLSQGRLSIPVKEKYETGQELEVEFILPDISEPQIIRARVEFQTQQPPEIRVAIINQEEVDRLMDRLAEIPSYNEFIESQKQKKVEILESQEEVVLKGGDEEREKPDEPEVVLKIITPEQKPCPEKAEIKERIPTKEAKKAQPRKTPIMREEIYSHSENTERIESSVRSEEIEIEIKQPEHADERKQKKAPLIREEIRHKPSEAKKEIPVKPEPEKAEAEVAEPEKKKSVDHGSEESEKKAEPMKPALSSDPITQLRNWLVKPKEQEKKRDKKKEEKKEGKEEEKEKELGDYEPVSKFVQSLVKAMLRSGYYSPDHPGSKDAKSGLYKEFTEALGEKEEIGFMIQFRPGQAPEFMVTGISSEPITLKKLLGPGTSELFFPKYVDYFERKKLINLTIKKTISNHNFHKFVDIMSDPTVDKGGPSESGRLLTRMLAEHNITEISAIFEDDLITLESKLPWRVEMGIHRLAKDLKVLPLYKGISKSELMRLKAKIVQDIIRPLRRPEFLKDILLNLYLIARQVPDIDREELEEAVIDNFPMKMLIPTSEYVFQELKRLSELKLETEEQKELINFRIESIKSILKKIAVKVLMEDIEGTAGFLEQLFYHKIVSFDELPPEVQDKINIQIMADEFQKQPYVWLGKFMEANKPDDLELFIKYFQKILTPLIDRKDFQSLYMITEQISKLPEKKRQALAEKGITDLEKTIWSNQVLKLIRILLEGGPDVRKGVEEIFILLGEFGLQKIYEALVEESDPNSRKLLIELLFRFGHKSMERLRGILKDPAKPVHLQMLAIEAIGRAKNPQDADLIKPFLRHSKPELRAEAISALVRIMGQDSVQALETLSSDSDLMVKKRWLAAIGFLAKNNAFLRARLSQVAFNEEELAEIRAQAIQEMTRNLPETDEERIELQGKLLELVTQRQSFSERLRHRFKTHAEEQDKPKIAALNLLGKIGDKNSLDALSSLKLPGKEMSAKLEEAIKQLRLRLGTEK